MSKQLMDADRGTFFKVDPDDLTIIDEKDNDFFDPRTGIPLHNPDVDRLIASILRHGVRKNVTVTVEGDGSKRQYIVVDGKQRVRAARYLKKKLIEQGDKKKAAMMLVPCFAEKRMDHAEAGLLQITLNEAVVPSTAMMKAMTAAHLVGRGVPIAKVAEEYDVKTQTISAWVKVVTSAPKVKKAVNDELITMTQAENIVAGQTEEEQEAMLEKVLAEAKENGGRTMPTSKIKALKKAKKTGAPTNFAPKRRTLRRLVENEEAVKELPTGVVLGIRIAIGDLNPNSVKGLAGFLHEASVRKTGPS